MIPVQLGGDHSPSSIRLDLHNIVEPEPEPVGTLGDGVVALLRGERDQGLANGGHTGALGLGELSVPGEHHPVHVGNTSSGTHDPVALAVAPSKFGHDVAQHGSLDDDEDGCDLKGVVVGIECVGEPTSGEAVLVSTVVKLRTVLLVKSSM